MSACKGQARRSKSPRQEGGEVRSDFKIMKIIASSEMNGYKQRSEDERVLLAGSTRHAAPAWCCGPDSTKLSVGIFRARLAITARIWKCLARLL
jgi:hypothetical protein